MKNKKVLLIVGCIAVVIGIIAICIISNINKENRIKANEIAAKKIENEIANCIFSKIYGTEIFVLRTNDNGEYLEEKFELSENKLEIINRKSENETWSKICMSISLSNEIDSDIGEPIYENEKIIGIGDDFYFATDEQKEMIKTFEQKETTKVSLSELLPICKDFLQKSISNGNLTSDLKTEYNQNDIDITITNDSIGVLSMRLYITYPTKQTPYSDAQITGIRVSAAYRNSSQKHNLKKYILPYLESFPNSLDTDDIVSVIKERGKSATEAMLKYNDVTTSYEHKGIKYSYRESFTFDSDVSFHDVLEIKINSNYNIYLSDYPGYNQ